MDQIRTGLAWLKRQHFWVLSVLIVLIGIVCWKSASGTIATKYDENQKKITTEFQSLATLRSDPFHPNKTIKDKQIAETNKLIAEVAKLWQQLYDRQREKVLEWPPVLRTDFVEYMDKLRFGEEIPQPFRERYQNYVHNHFPKLPEKVSARPIPEGSTGAGGGLGFTRGMERSGLEMNAAGQAAEDDDYICVWLEEDQALVRKDLEFRQTPSALRIWWTQENLWVYHTLLDAIKNTNEAVGATRQSNAAVRTIISLQVGKRAAPFSRTPNRIYKLATAEVADAESTELTEPVAEGEGMEGRFDVGDSEGSGPMSAAQEMAMLFSKRYLGEDGKPISTGGGGVDGEPVDSSSAAPFDATIFGKEYKRLPVRMVLEMDQRQLPKLISECAIRPLQVEVQEVRINPPDLMEGSGLPGFSGGFGMGGDGGSVFTDVTGLQEFAAQPNIAKVVIQGVIYIFTEPDPELLKPTDEEAPLAATP
jgi:hypothetical protein